MKEEGKMRADGNRKALSKVPMPGMRAVEICHTVEDVKLQEVELNQSPLKIKKRNTKDIRDSYILTNIYLSSKDSLVWRVYLSIENTVNQRWNQQSCSSKIKIAQKDEMNSNFRVKHREDVKANLQTQWEGIYEWLASVCHLPSRNGT